MSLLETHFGLYMQHASDNVIKIFILAAYPTKMSGSFQDELKLREILAGTRAQSVKELSWTVLGYNSE